MTALRASKVYRSATTSGRRRPETSHCSLSASDKNGTLDISFDLALKRGARTSLILAIGKADLTPLIREAVSLWPDMGSVLAKTMVGTMAAALEKQRTFQATVASRALKRLEQVDHALDALADEDLPRGAVRKVLTAGSALEEARGTLEAF